MSSERSGDDLDLTPEQRQRIDALFARLGEMTHHEALGVEPTASRTAIRRAYFARAAEFHADKFFRKRIGTYRAKVDAISRRITEAYDALQLRGNDAQEAPPAPAKSAPPAPPAAKRPDAAEALAALKKQVEGRRAEALRWLAEARQATGHGDHARAVEMLQKAAALAPSDATIKSTLETAKRAVDAGAADALVRQAEFEERFNHWGEAARTWQRILDARPDDARARERLAAARARAHEGGR